SEVNSVLVSRVTSGYKSLNLIYLGAIFRVP
ncbi:hypothetical protein A2U01_0089624, partial [Trifolium medium]|nr:hypothetical protein [Trifolium medium]